MGVPITPISPQGRIKQSQQSQSHNQHYKGCREGRTGVFPLLTGNFNKLTLHWSDKIRGDLPIIYICATKLEVSLISKKFVRRDVTSFKVLVYSIQALVYCGTWPNFIWNSCRFELTKWYYILAKTRQQAARPPGHLNALPERKPPMSQTRSLFRLWWETRRFLEYVWKLYFWKWFFFTLNRIFLLKSLLEAKIHFEPTILFWTTHFLEQKKNGTQ